MLDFKLNIHMKRGFPGSSARKESVCTTRDHSSIPGPGRSTGDRNSYTLQYSDLENFRLYSPWGHKEPDMTE